MKFQGGRMMNSNSKTLSHHHHHHHVIGGHRSPILNRRTLPERGDLRNKAFRKKRGSAPIVHSSHHLFVEDEVDLGVGFEEPVYTCMSDDRRGHYWGKGLETMVGFPNFTLQMVTKRRNVKKSWSKLSFTLYILMYSFVLSLIFHYWYSSFKPVSSKTFTSKPCSHVDLAFVSTLLSTQRCHKGTSIHVTHTTIVSCIARYSIPPITWVQAIYLAYIPLLHTVKQCRIGFRIYRSVSSVDHWDLIKYRTFSLAQGAMTWFDYNLIWSLLQSFSPLWYFSLLHISLCPPGGVYRFLWLVTPDSVASSR